MLCLLSCCYNKPNKREGAFYMTTLNHINNNLTNISYAATLKGDAAKVNKKQSSSYSMDTLELSSQTSSNYLLSKTYNNAAELANTVGDMAHTAINVSETLLNTSKDVMDTINNTYNSLYKTAKDTVDTINHTLELSSNSYNHLKTSLTIMKDSAINIAGTVTLTAGKIASNLSKIASAAVTTYGTLKAINSQPTNIFTKGIQSAYTIYNGASNIWNNMKEIHTSVSEGYENISKNYDSFTYAASNSLTSALELKNSLQTGANAIYENGLTMTETTKNGAVEIYHAISNGYISMNNQLSSHILNPLQS